MASFDEIWKKSTEKKPTEEVTEKEITEEIATEETSEPEIPKITGLQNLEEEEEEGEESVSSEEIFSEETKEVTKGIWGESISSETESVEKIPTETPIEVIGEKPVAPYLSVTPVIFDEETKLIKVDGVTYDLNPDRGGRKLVVTDYGLKGEGKTGFAFSFPGRIACLSFDRKSKQVWEEMYNKAPRIVVYDAIRYLDKSSGSLWLKTADKTFKYVMLLLDEVIIPTKPDWIVIDGAEIFTQLCEMVMRYRNGVQPFQGIKNLNLWKERRMFIDQLHNKCISIAQEGVIYTTYTSKDEVVEDGQFVTRKDVPKWVDAIMYYTDVVIRVKSEQGKEGAKFIAIIESSKVKKLPTGARKDVTNKGVESLYV